MSPQPINQHAWPGRGDISMRRGQRLPIADRLRAHPGLVLVAAAERAALPEWWGLGIALRTIGTSVTGAHLVVADDLEQREPEAFRQLTQWASPRVVSTPAGPLSLEVITRSQLCDPAAGILTTTCYTGGGWLLTADEGRSLGLLADYWQASQGQRFRGGFTLGLPGWGEIEDRTDRRASRHQGWRPKLHRPTLRAKAIGGHGLLAEFNKAGRGGRTPDGARAGHWERNHRGQWLPSRGRIVDLIGPAFAFDGIDTSDLSEHLAAFGLPTLGVPAAVTIDADSADRLFGVATSCHRLAVALDAEAAQWLTSREDRLQGRATVGLRFQVSPGSLAGAALRRSGISPPLLKFATPDDAALDRWAAAGHGGWTT